MKKNRKLLLKLQLRCSTDILADVRSMVSDTAIEAGFPKSVAFQLALAVDEACANIILHGFEGNSKGKFELEIFTTVEGLVVTLHDSGRPFSGKIPLSIDLSGLIKEGRKGGLGLYMIGRVIDLVEYHTDRDGQNHLRLFKKRPPNR